VLGMTHLAFWGEASTSRLAVLLRGKVAPLAAPVIPALMRRRSLVAGGIRVLSQMQVEYRASPLSVEGNPRSGSGPRAGDRLPDMAVKSAGRSIGLHELLARPGVHVLLDRDADRFETLALGPLVHVHRLTGRPGRGLIAVRPDGYVGFRCQTAEEDQLATWLSLAGVAVRRSDAGPQAVRSCPASWFQLHAPRLSAAVVHAGGGEPVAGGRVAVPGTPATGTAWPRIRQTEARLRCAAL
jgi:hypothetical protein